MSLSLYCPEFQASLLSLMLKTDEQRDKTHGVGGEGNGPHVSRRHRRRTRLSLPVDLEEGIVVRERFVRQLEAVLSG